MSSFGELINALRARGYDDLFVAEENGLRAQVANQLFDPDELVVERHWHQGDNDLFALSTTSQQDPAVRGIYQHDHDDHKSPDDESIVTRLRDKAMMESLDPIDGNERVAKLEQSFQHCNEKLREMVSLYEREKNQHAASVARLQRESQRQLEDWKNQFLEGFLEVLDDLDRALEAAKGASVSPSIREGLQLVANRFHAKLGEHDVYRLNNADEKSSRFDPRLHEAIATVAAAHPKLDGSVIDEVRAGYMRGERVLRPARVTVGKFSPNTE